MYGIPTLASNRIAKGSLSSYCRAIQACPPARARTASISAAPQSAWTQGIVIAKMRRTTSPSAYTIATSQRWQCMQYSRLYISCTLFVVSTNIATRIITPPLYRLVELTICRAYYQAHNPSVIGRTGDVAEEYCKLDIVQEKLAYLMGIVETIKIICGE